MLTNAVLKIVRQFYRAAEIADVANTVSACSEQPQQTI